MAERGLTVPVFSILSALIEERAGLHFGPEDRELFSDKIALRLAEAGFDSALDYYYFLRYDPAGPAALDALVDVLVVNETYFFREVDALRMVLTEFVGDALARGETPRIWSAACSTGEEPLTLAMMLAERGWLGKVELVATDLSERVLARARAGKFGPRALRSTPPEMKSKYFEVGGSEVAVRPALCGAVQWKQLNLLDEEAIARMGTFDVIFCRNVLIYFSDATTRRVVGALSKQLRPHHPLVVGTSESLLRFGTQLTCEERGGVFFYSRTDA